MSLAFYSEQEENEKEESLNNYKYLFSEYQQNLPSLEDALNQLFKSKNINDSKINELTLDILNKCKKVIETNFNKIQNIYNNISKEDSYIICSYTCESKESDKSPYKILNKNMAEENRKYGIQNVSKYLYIFLKSLRKLKRYHPTKENKYLYDV